MAYPTDLDNFTPKSDDINDVMATDVNELQTAIEAIEAKVGIDASANTDSLDYKVAQNTAKVSFSGPNINSATEKTTPVDADMVGLMDSAASNVLKKLSWTNIKATLKTYFDTLYQTTLGFTPENSANKKTTITDSDTDYPTGKAVKTAVDAKVGAGAIIGSGLTQATDRLLGRTTASTGAIEEISTGVSLSLASGSLNTIQNIRTSDSPQFTGIELGHASDTTLSRGAAGFLAVEGKRVPSPASQASGDLLYRGATEWARLPKGTAGQVLTMNSGATAPEWAEPAGGGGDPSIITGLEGTSTIFSDDINNLAMYRSADGNIFLMSRSLAPQAVRYKTTNAQQIHRTNVWASAGSSSTVMVVNGYIYFFTSSGSAAKIFRCAVSSDISNGANWAELTISGMALPVSNTGFRGYGNGKFWVADHSNTRLIPYTLSGTTLTSGTVVVNASASHASEYLKVNSNGIYYYYTSAPHIRKANFAGDLSNDNFMSSISGTFVLPNSFYNGSFYNTTGGVVGFYKLD